MTTDLDLTEAIEAAAKVLAYEAEEDSLDEALPWDAATEDYKSIFRLSAREVLAVAVPLVAAQAVKAERLRLADIVHGCGDEAATDYARDILHAIAGSIRREAEATNGK